MHRVLSDMRFELHSTCSMLVSRAQVLLASLAVQVHARGARLWLLQAAGWCRRSRRMVSLLAVQQLSW